VANSGVTQLLTHLLMQGTTTRSAEQVATEIESVGGSLDTYSGNNTFGVSAEVMSGDFGIGLELLADVLLRPVFPAEAIERERAIQLAGLKAQRDQMLSSAFRQLRATIFGAAGYGLDGSGTEETVARLTRDDFVAQHTRLIRPGNAVLAIFGDLDPDSVAVGVSRAFGGWGESPGDGFRVANAVGAPWRPGGRFVETRTKKQGVVTVGFPGTSLNGSDRYALELIQEACSDLGSRLFLRVRERLGLAYYVGAQNFVGLVPGYFAFYAGTAPEHVERVERELLAEAVELASHGLTPEELRRAKAKVIGQRKIARQELGGLALTMALDELYGLGFGHSETDDARFEAVTQEDTRAVAVARLQADQAVVSVLKGDAAAAE